MAHFYSLYTTDGTPHDTTIEAGSFYELDHADLPPRTPVQLWSIRVVMVSENTEVNVSVRFPSVQSLKTYFSNRIKEIFPALDEKFVMGTVLAGKVLRRQIPFEEFTEKKHLEGFWMASTEPIGGLGEVISKKGTCLFELASNGIVRWGVRRQVKYLGRHKENINPQSSFVTGEGKAIIEEGVKKDKDVFEEEEEEGEDKGDEEYEADEVDKKRKRYSFREVTKVAKKPKVEKQIQVYNPKSKKKCRQLVLKSPTDRWSEQRYKLAERNLLEVMQAQGAVFGNPILRPALRTEARKRIGDTGLLDHLLKHMAGKVAPGGKERFRRRHNAEGAMEYWLESADLVNIRKEAGVQDPYWTPPPGWKPGDCISKDSISANELRLLKEEISNMKRYK
ncbi:hypothetical protein RJ639_033143 [Escallonia herrerae]|uniref:PTC1-like winged helix-turn-helix domain-containing protein n=1 Tax=Escallonia herrerae TaxID=1293975 RepID=A0AA88WY08_9ASTE|nr:hypothetical protein RJ639_033143 [Escallonia herrerae]